MTIHWKDFPENSNVNLYRHTRYYHISKSWVFFLIQNIIFFFTIRYNISTNVYVTQSVVNNTIFWELVLIEYNLQWNKFFYLLQQAFVRTTILLVRRGSLYQEYAVAQKIFYIDQFDIPQVRYTVKIWLQIVNFE